MFLWFTFRSNEVGRGYGTLLRVIYGALAAGALLCGVLLESLLVRDVVAGLVALLALVAIWWGPKWRDLIPVAVGSVGLIAAAVDAGGNTTVSILRILVGVAFLGAVSDAMLLGHWYLVQPGMPRRLLNEIVRMVLWILPFEVFVLLLPTGMISAIKGTVDDGWNGTLAWFWVACAIGTGVLAAVTLAALKEKSYSAVMAATGLMYLAILTAFGTDLVACAVLAG